MQATPSQLGATPRGWEKSYTTVSWDYPPSPAAYYHALLSRDTSTPLHLTSTTPLTCPDSVHQKQAILHLPPIPPFSLSRSCVHARPRSTHPTSHTLKRRQPQWPKPPHYHASLLRSPLSRRKGLFRAVLPSSKAVDFFRLDVLAGARHRTRSGDGDACASLHVVECVLEPYEAAAGFFGWHGLGLDATRRVQGDGDEDEWCWRRGLGLDRDGGLSDVPFKMHEAAVEQGRARWARMAEELVGPPGLALRSFAEDGKSGKDTSSSDQAHNGIVDAYPPWSIASRREGVRWDPDIDSSPYRPPRAPSASEEKRKWSPSTSKPERKPDSPSASWYTPSSHRGPPPTPHLPSHRFLPPPYVQYGPPPLQFSPWFPGGRVASAQGHGYWYGAEPLDSVSFSC
ncbi:hypothetical protein V8E55_009075 [Tylopilus felleus]